MWPPCQVAIDDHSEVTWFGVGWDGFIEEEDDLMTSEWEGRIALFKRLFKVTEERQTKRIDEQIQKQGKRTEEQVRKIEDRVQKVEDQIKMVEENMMKKMDDLFVLINK